MSIKKLWLPGLLALVLAVPVPASAWRAINRNEVLPVSEGVWEVVARSRSGAQDYWCSIADFAIRQLRAPVNQRIYVWRGEGPSVNRPGRKAVQFAFGLPPGVPDRSGSLSLNVRQAGDSLRVTAAQTYCYDRLPGRDRWLP
ncbi:hypothetical protein PNH50_12180 [Leisingera aquaemixtae]|jgi:hypothetical protein|uniref:Uncharacterized protein n=1 Tax=Leisingera aquaemixtae TaxID=1396826 RepID=A0A0P1HU20_9RHOB|nr:MULTISPECIES: hypothetical protein [Leisingera]QDI75181.1 hypothetical protein R2C4_05230 [Leisingera aquaemixtae]UWQ23713.1 hypothetical protein K3553_12070 [Leisingera aquaemixtae]UWQ36237.1 hypothetical protein K3552_11975 [Leisingera aquaemixtae]UWQ44597.1 hypothetical protein K3719_12410 [Leisingera aquaemixtae]CUH98091.1 hypothetical protein PHA8399_00198 [Leisingera aquaemixtae]